MPQLKLRCARRRQGQQRRTHDALYHAGLSVAAQQAKQSDCLLRARGIRSIVAPTHATRRPLTLPEGSQAYTPTLGSVHAIGQSTRRKPSGIQWLRMPARAAGSGSGWVGRLAYGSGATAASAPTAESAGCSGAGAPAAGAGAATACAGGAAATAAAGAATAGAGAAANTPSTSMSAPRGGTGNTPRTRAT